MQSTSNGPRSPSKPGASRTAGNVLRQRYLKLFYLFSYRTKCSIINVYIFLLIFGQNACKHSCSIMFWYLFIFQNNDKLMHTKIIIIRYQMCGFITF